MVKKPGNIPFFWQELKRRKVIKAAAMYAATTFIIMEAAEIMLPRLGLPDWTVTLVIVLLIVGFPITLILSWIFDVTPKGVEKTVTLEEDNPSDEPSQNKQGIFRLSNMVIAILLTTVCILLYPKLFSKDKFEEIRDEKGKITVAVMPFENLTGDSLYDVWQGGFQNLLISALSNSEELQVRRYQTMSSILGQKQSVNLASVTPSLAREVALDLETKTYILGKILKAGNMIRLSAQLLNAETEEIYKTYQVDCPDEADAFSKTDSLGSMIRNYLEIRKFSDGLKSPGANASSATNSPEAFGYYIHAYVFLSFSYTGMLQFKRSEEWCDKAYAKRDHLPVKQKLFLDHLHAYHYETPLEEIKYCKLILELDEMNSIYWFMLGDAYTKREQYEESIISFEKVIEIHEKWETPIPFPHMFIWMGDALHQIGEHQKENEIYELGVSAVPGYSSIAYCQAICALFRGEREKADEYLNRYCSIRTSEGRSEAWNTTSLGYIYLQANLSEEAEKFFRQGHILDPDNPRIMNGLAWILIDQDIDLEEGMDLAEKAVNLDPESYAISDTWGWGLYKQGRYVEALDALNKAWELRGPYDPEIMQHIQATEKALAETIN